MGSEALPRLIGIGIAWGLIRRINFVRRAAMLVAVAGIAMLVLPVSAAAAMPEICNLQFRPIPSRIFLATNHADHGVEQHPSSPPAQSPIQAVFTPKWPKNTEIAPFAAPTETETRN
jgi:hypothetical protein